MMPPTLISPHDFSEGDQIHLQAFDCGSNPWEILVAEWIKGQGVIESIRRFKNRVWLYSDPSGVLVGFGSLGMTKWRWPGPLDPYRQISIIPMLGVQYQYQGQPDDVPKSQRFSAQIMDNLQDQSLTHDTDFLTLEVHEHNTRAIRFYESFGFAMLPEPQIKQFSTQNHVYRRMAIRKR